MSDFTVVVAPIAAEKIAECAIYISEQAYSVEIGLRWIDQVYDAIGTLAFFPQRFEFAEENAHRDYEIRRLIIGNYLALYTIDDALKVVRVVGFRHAARLARPEELPIDPS